MKRKGFYKSNKYPQRTCDFFTVNNGLLSNKAYCLATDKNGNVYIGTEGGLNYTKADGSIGSFKCEAVKTAYTAKDGTVYFAGGKTLYSIANGNISELQSFESPVLDMSGIDDAYLLTADALFKLEDGKFVEFFHNEAAATCLAINNSKITASNPDTLNIVNGKRKHWMTIFPSIQQCPTSK